MNDTLNTNVSLLLSSGMVGLSTDVSISSGGLLSFAGGQCPVSCRSVSSGIQHHRQGRLIDDLSDACVAVWTSFCPPREPMFLCLSLLSLF